MANVFIEESTMTAIGDAIRAKTGKSENILPANMPAEIESIKVGSGGTEGDSYYNTFWDAYQNNGEPMSYYYAFSYNRFNNDSYNPKYPIICEGNNTARYMFYNTTNVTSTKVPIDVTRATGDLLYAFGCYGVSPKLETIVELIVDEDTVFGVAAFSLANSLKNIKITGTIGTSLSFQWSPLTRDSILSVYHALSTNVTGQTCTFKKSAVNAAFTTEEWEALIAPKKPYWTFTLA